jgi:hypothetical protein
MCGGPTLPSGSSPRTHLVTAFLQIFSIDGGERGLLHRRTCDGIGRGLCGGAIAEGFGGGGRGVARTCAKCRGRRWGRCWGLGSQSLQRWGLGYLRFTTSGHTIHGEGRSSPAATRRGDKLAVHFPLDDHCICSLVGEPQFHLLGHLDGTFHLP